MPDPSTHKPAADKTADKTEPKPQTDKAPDTTPKAELSAKSEVDLAAAAESTDPVVHQALAEHDGALTNRAALVPDDGAVKAADEAIEAAEKRLHDLGY